MISCILLSAGLSKRFTSPKALAILSGNTVITRLQNMLITTVLDEVIIVLGASADRIKPLILNHKKIKIVYNKDYNLGQTSSFQASLKAISSKSKAIVLLPVDYPLIKSDSIDFLIECFNNEKSKIIIPTFNRRRGHPPVFSTILKDEFLSLDKDKGINSVIHRHEKEVVEVRLEDQGIIQTFNTKEELELIYSKQIN